MTGAEILALEGRVRTVCARVIDGHCTDRMSEKNVTGREIANCLKWGEVIEAHNEAGEWRAVMRLDSGRPKVGVCCVVELSTGRIITVWKNAGADCHKTLNLNAYTLRVNLVSLGAA